MRRPTPATLRPAETSPAGQGAREGAQSMTISPVRWRWSPGHRAAWGCWSPPGWPGAAVGCSCARAGAELERAGRLPRPPDGGSLGPFGMKRFFFYRTDGGFTDQAISLSPFLPRGRASIGSSPRYGNTLASRHMLKCTPDLTPPPFTSPDRCCLAGPGSLAGGLAYGNRDWHSPVEGRAARNSDSGRRCQPPRRG